MGEILFFMIKHIPVFSHEKYNAPGEQHYFIDDRDEHCLEGNLNFKKKIVSAI